MLFLSVQWKSLHQLFQLSDITPSDVKQVNENFRCKIAQHYQFLFDGKTIKKCDSPNRFFLY